MTGRQPPRDPHHGPSPPAAPPRDNPIPAGHGAARAVARRWGAHLREHQDFWTLLALAAAFRLPLLLVVWGIDYWFYLSLGKLSNFGYYPYLHYWLEYPPVFPWIAVAAYRFALTFPPTIYGDFETTYHLVLGAPLIGAELAVIGLIYAIGLRLGPREEALRRAALYAALFWPVLVALGWYDALPAAMLLLGLYLVLRGRAGGAGLLAGLGFMTKVFPVLLFPVAVKFLPRRRDRIRAVAGTLIVTVAIAGPLLWLSPTYFVASYRATLSRSAWETVWALLDGYYSYGKVAPLGVRFDPSTAGYVAYESGVPTLPVAGAFAALFAGLWLRPAARTPRNVVLFTAISTLLFLLYSKGYSPQFILYVLPFVALLLPWRRALGYALALSLLNLLEWPLYHEWLGEVHWVLAVAVIGRTALYVALCWEWLAELWSWRNPLRALDRRLALGGLAALLVLSCPAGVVAWQSWTRAFYQGSQLRPAFDFVRRYDQSADAGRAAFVFADEALYEQFYPHFGGDGDFYLFRPDFGDGIALKAPRFTPEGRRAELARVARDHRQLFLIRAADDWTSRDLNAWLTEHAVLRATLRLEQADISVWQLPPPR